MSRNFISGTNVVGEKMKYSALVSGQVGKSEVQPIPPVRGLGLVGLAGLGQFARPACALCSSLLTNTPAFHYRMYPRGYESPHCGQIREKFETRFWVIQNHKLAVFGPC